MFVFTPEWEPLLYKNIYVFYSYNSFPIVSIYYELSYTIDQSAI